jgi:hypothetical protein
MWEFRYKPEQAVHVCEQLVVSTGLCVAKVQQALA